MIRQPERLKLVANQLADFFVTEQGTHVFSDLSGRSFRRSPLYIHAILRRHDPATRKTKTRRQSVGGFLRDRTRHACLLRSEWPIIPPFATLHTRYFEAP